MTKPAPSAAWVLICLLCLALVLSPTAPALAVQFPSEVTYDSNGSDANDNILADTGTTFTVEYGVTYTLSGVLSGTGDLIQTDYGTLVLSGVNTYTGNTIVEDHGTLSVSRDENLGEASGKLLLRLAGGLQTTATFSSDRRVEWTDGGGAITTAAGTTLTLNGQLSGDGYLVKKGDGTLVLTNTTNYYRDNVHVTAGVLRAGAAGALCTADYSVFGTLDLNNFNLTIGRLDGAATGQVNLGSATLTIDLPDTADYIGEFTGSGTLIKKGTYTQGFGGDSSSFTGKLILEEGGLRLDATTKFGGTFTQKSGTVLTTSASGTTLGAATFKGTVSPKGTLNVASASFDGATVDLSSNLNTNKIVASGAIAFNGAGTTIKLGDLSAATPGSYLLMTGSGISGLDKVTADVTLGAAQRGAFSLSESDTKLNYGLVTGPQTLTWDGTATAYAWNNSSTNVNWSSGTFNINFKDGDAVIFDSSAANKNVVVDSAGVTVSTMDVNDDYNFSGGKITASGAVTVADGKSLGLVAGSAEALNAASVNFNTSGKLNITGYVPD
ncbi:autotransporter-associated beta strand repeat-containing protein, partial [Desulfovibrio sp. OttesenSCG-928-G15]|nr:autotransporter-associated beta strand repeat-containing protein [Desulfovibrio sp. OttesenSCG-928-G15]